jgi:hypothetical protein
MQCLHINALLITNIASTSTHRLIHLSISRPLCSLPLCSLLLGSPAYVTVEAHSVSIQ